MGHADKVSYQKRTPKFLQQFHEDHPEVRASESLKAVAAAHQERDESERPVREDERPVVVNLDEFEVELKSENKHLYEELTGRVADAAHPSQNVQEDETEEKLPEPLLSSGTQHIVEVGDGFVATRSEDKQADFLENETGRHAFRKRSHMSGEKSKKKSKKRKQVKSLLSFGDEDL